MPAIGINPEVAKARSAVAVAHHRKFRDPEVIEDARRSLATAKLADYIERVLAEAPPLSPSQRARLRDVLAGGGHDAT